MSARPANLLAIGRLALRSLLASLVVGSILTFGAGPAGAVAPGVVPTVVPAVMGGAPVPGSPGVVALLVRSGSAWSLCSAAVWRPRLLITAGHCLTQTGTATPADEIRVFAPGVTLGTSVDGSQGVAPVTAVRWWTRDGFVNGSSIAPPNDLAVIELSGDIGPPAFARLATTAQLQRWANANEPLTITGYGLTAAGQQSQVPNTVNLPITRLSLAGPNGAQVTIGATPEQSACPGDSGGPTTHQDATGTMLIGPLIGGQSTCINPGTVLFRNVATIAIAYVDVLNRGLASIGAPLVPSAPTETYAVGRSADTVTVTWRPPTVAPEAVVGYDVMDASGSVLCQTTQLRCTIGGLPPGELAVSVRARNAENEGDAAPPTAQSTLGVGPSVTMQPPWIAASASGRPAVVVRTLRRTSSVAIRKYVVMDSRNRTICSGLPARPYDDFLTCDLPTRPGIYRLRVKAVTNAGTTRPSAPGTPFAIR